MYTLHISSKARREIKIISRFHQEAILNALADIREDPLSGKPLARELTGRFTYKVGAFRIIYSINKQDNIVNIISAGHRATVYQ